MKLFTSIGKSNRLRSSDVEGIPGIVYLEGLNADNVLIKSVGFSQAAGVQFMQTLSKSIYVYTFGERMGAVQVDGLALWNPCVGSAGSGLAKVLAYYKNNSVTVRNSTISVGIGALNAIEGYLIDIHSTASDPENGVIGFRLSLATLPEMWG